MIFDDAVTAALTKAMATCAQRGSEYLDSWALENQRTVYLDATLSAFGNVSALSPEQKRLVVLASMLDVKLSRMAGPWKTDTTEDAINYLAAYTTLRQEYEAKAHV